MAKISLSRDGVKYLVFEGGGGLGLVYLGAIEALEDMLGRQPQLAGGRHIQVPRCLFPIQPIYAPAHIESRPFRGVCGASAGAITAFMLALGMSSDEIDQALSELHGVILDKGNPEGSIEQWSATEKFFDPPDLSMNRVFRPNFVGADRSEFRWNNQEKILPLIKKIGTILTTGIVDRFLFPATSKLRQWPTVLKRLLLRGDLNSMNLKGGYGGIGSSMTNSFTDSVRFSNHDNAAKYLHSLLLGRGLFSGVEARSFFRKLIENRLVAAHFAVYQGTVPLDPDLSFKEFYNITGVDLVVTGVNISRHEPRYFSLWHTPDFPVVEAVALSMSVPIVFRPVYVEGGVRQGDKDQNTAYQGLYVDGGMLNNYPVRAFDTIAKRTNLSNGEPIKFQEKEVADIGGVFLAVDVKEGTGGNEPFLGFRLVDIGRPNAQPDEDQAAPPVTDIDNLFPANGNPKVGIDLIKDLYFTCMYPANAGQIRYANDQSRTVPLNVNGLDLLDFAHPNADIANKRIMKNGEGLGQWKIDLIKEAQHKVETRVEP